jgi:hypothetical protein
MHFNDLVLNLSNRWIKEKQTVRLTQLRSISSLVQVKVYAVTRPLVHFSTTQQDVTTGIALRIPTASILLNRFFSGFG